MNLPSGKSWKIAKSELVCVAIYYIQLLYIFTVIWSKFALKSGFSFDLNNPRDMAFNSLPFLLLDCKGCCYFSNIYINWKGVNKLISKDLKISVVFGSITLLITVDVNRFCPI